MFITVKYGAGCWELVNPWCSLVTLTAHLKQRGQIPPDGEESGKGLGKSSCGTPRQECQLCSAPLHVLPVTIALLAEDGHLVSLDKGLETSSTPSMGSSLLQERRTYILVRIIKGEDGAPNCYESLLENLDDQSPELAEELRWLSGLPAMGNSPRRRLGTRNGLQEQDPPSRSRRVGSIPSKTR
ncbi:uncharacterized protein C22orf15-like isoform X1 [Perognathus longimembris pacificus]|uniref:uncharacterized protein C22orf15-like isoform X1 n=1 Tax=Perognathus longimembris pacificus TaxID=214514 RepID=UPI002019B0A1|nr:uncharacterized protein C22orf15-like isoform X1 [Perognathus longimembris pacificus]XP_048199543.1 uncharacterized protein C22orf15-like isoform X1 [Perognathus longimembris pacificus]